MKLILLDGSVDLCERFVRREDILTSSLEVIPFKDWDNNVHRLTVQKCQTDNKGNLTGFSESADSTIDLVIVGRLAISHIFDMGRNGREH